MSAWNPAGSVDAYVCSQIQFRLRFASLRHCNPSNGLPAGFCVKLPPDQMPFGNPGPRWLILTPLIQTACSPFVAETGLLSFTSCSTHIHVASDAPTAGLLSSRLPQYVPSAAGRMFFQ